MRHTFWGEKEGKVRDITHLTDRIYLTQLGTVNSVVAYSGG